MLDQRYESMKSRLEKLTDTELQRIINSDELCLDSWNYDQETGRFCPLATALNIPNQLRENGIRASQQIVLEMIQNSRVGFGTVKGLSGRFYTENREQDLKGLCEEILNDRKF